MPEARPCPHCGAPMPVESPTLVEEPDLPAAQEPAREADPAKDLELPTVPLLAPGSHDDDFFSMSSSSRIVPAEPDPILGQYVTPSSTSTLIEGPPRSRSGDGFPRIDLGSKIAPGSHRESSKLEESIAEADADEEYEPEDRRSSWPLILLASYASAITLGLAWTLMKDRSREKTQAAEGRPIAVVVAEPARQAGLSRKVEPPEPILGEHVAQMGRPLKVGDLEVTPIGVKRQTVTLVRSTAFANGDRKQGGKGALVLRLKLKNISKDAVFAPLDLAYLRERGKGIVDTFIETATDERIYPYPLAIESEWSIVDQGFEVLRPGESREVAIVSAPDAPPDSSGPFTWRVRLRTGINRNDAIGLRWPEK
jgi:hypothetical protein